VQNLSIKTLPAVVLMQKTPSGGKFMHAGNSCKEALIEKSAWIIIVAWVCTEHSDRDGRRLVGWAFWSAPGAIWRSCRRMPVPTCLPAT